MLDCVSSHGVLLVCVCVCLGLQVEAAGWELSKGQQLQTAVETVTRAGLRPRDRPLLICIPVVTQSEHIAQGRSRTVSAAMRTSSA